MWTVILSLVTTVASVCMESKSAHHNLYHPSLPSVLSMRFGGGPLRDSTLGLVEAMWLGPENAGVYLGSPSILRVNTTGRILISHDFFGRSTLNYTVQVLASDDGGCSFRLLSNVSGMYWASIFEHRGTVYLLGTATDNHPLIASGVVISKSTDDGATWSAPVTVLPGNASDPRSQYHGAPTSVVTHAGKLYRAFETSSQAGYGHYTCMLSWVDEDGDLTDPQRWGRTLGELSIDGTMIPKEWDPQGKYGWQEGNAVVGPDGVMRNILRVDGQTNKTFNKAAVTLLSRDGRMVFEKMIDFPSCSSKFSIRQHAASGLYYTLSTSVTAAAVGTDTVYARNNLVLAFSKDLFHWKVCTTLLTDDTGYGLGTVDSAKYTGFHYVDWIFDGLDILYAVRTGYRGANSFHNSNRVTFKKLEGFAAHCK